MVAVPTLVTMPEMLSLCNRRSSPYSPAPAKILIMPSVVTLRIVLSADAAM